MGGSHEWRVAHSSRGCSVLGVLDRRPELEFQQNISKRRLGVVVLRAGSYALEELPLIPAALTAIEAVQRGQVVRLRKPDAETPSLRRTSATILSLAEDSQRSQAGQFIARSPARGTVL
jgi:hypothetical protein